MKKVIILLSAIVIFAACSSKGKNTEARRSSVHKYVSFVQNIEGYDVAYTEDGHTIIYKNDSIGNVIVYYLKFDNTIGRHRDDRIKEKMIRVEMDSSLNSPKNIVSIYGGAFFIKNNLAGYDVYFFDDQIVCDSIKQIEVPLNEELKDDFGKKNEIKRIMELFHVVYQMALIISNNNVSGWNSIVSAFETSQDIIGYDVVISDTLINTMVKERIKIIGNSTDRFTHYYNLLQEKLYCQDEN